MSLGSQLVNASQIMILGRMAGLEAAATFAIGTKFYALGSQLTGRLIESSAPALTEMVVQGDHTRLRRRFGDIFTTSLALATAGSVALVAANAMIVEKWTGGVIVWRFSWDLILGLLLLANTASRCLVGLFGIAGDLRPVRNLYLIEAVFFVTLGIPAAQSLGILGLLGASLIAHLIVTGFFSATAARQVIGSLLSLRGQILISLALVIAAAFVASLLQDIEGFLRLPVAAFVILGFSLVAVSAMLSPEAKSRIVKKMLNFWGSTQP
jgi:O-antigen/teichoic acid export membrane protein